MNRTSTSFPGTASAHDSGNDSQFSNNKPPPPSTTYFADAFTVSLDDAWNSNTVYCLRGPVEDEFQHIIRINVDPEVGDIAMVDYAGRRVEQQTEALENGQVSARSRTKLDNDLPASRVVFSLTSGADRPLLQEDWYLVYHEVGYRLSARFTEQSLPVVGPKVEHIFRSFEPHPPLRHRR